MTNEALELLLRSFDDELDEQDRRRLDERLAASRETRIELARIRRIRDMISAGADYAFHPSFADDVMRRIPRNITPSRHHREADRPPVRARTRRLTAGAVVVVVLVAVGIVLYLQPRSITVPNGEMRTVELAGGSTVQLGGGSTMTYPRSWDAAERRVRLEGEGFFDIVESGRPFVVETFNATVTMLGTTFNVRAWPDETRPETSVAVATGRVGVSARASTQSSAPAAARLEPYSVSVRLESGQTTSVLGDSAAVLRPRDIALDHVLSWRSGGVAFVDRPLRDVFERLERKFGVEVRSSDVAVRGRFLTYLNPSPESAEDVVADVCHTLDLRYRRTANGFEVLTPSQIDTIR